ncbi:exportin-2-like [Rhopilema esculentum]|uniref:exportin-2-like n=1 Tax=Rhopilema esculentum TaxID=499914 RepID=UPI0031E2D375|eukprot:gene7857-13735_t
MSQAALDLNPQTLQELSVCLQATLSTEKQERKKAEDYLHSVEGVPNYGLLLLKLLDSPECEMYIRVAAAVNFKNYVKRNWRIVEGEANKICDADRLSIKQLIVSLMLKNPEALQRQLSDAISIIGREDFPEKWQNLLPEMIQRIQTGQPHEVNGILQTAHSLFKRFRYSFKSQELWTELKFVLENFAAPMTDLFEKQLETVKANLNNAKQLKETFNILVIISKLFYSLNYQDLPEYFEDNMRRWMTNFHFLLVTDFAVLKTEDSDEAGPLEKLRSQICDNVTLYAQKYDEEFQPYLPDFVTAVWTLLTSTNNDVKHDLLVSNAILFLASVCERPHYKDLFKEEGTLQSICQKVIVPNMEFREADEEAFEDNPEEYIRRDIEGSDIDTRRRAACDLVRGLCKYFETSVISIFSQYVNYMLELYAKSPAEHWKSKDTAIYLVTSLAAKKQTSKHGTTEASQLVNLVDFFKSHIAPDLQSPNVDEYPVLKADAIKYVITFRSVLPRNLILSVIPFLVNMIKAKNPVVHSYAANAVERIMTLRSPGGGPPLSAAELRTVKEQLFANLFNALEMQGSHENEYVMKAIMRSCSLLQETLTPNLELIISKLVGKLTAVSKNPSKPQFNHYLFEAICVLVGRVMPKTSREYLSKFESVLLPVFEGILREDVTEFLPYVFQVLSLLLEVREEGIQGPFYMALFPLLVNPQLWDRPGNIPALTRLLQAYVKRGSKQIIADGKLLALLGVFQKLIASRNNDHEGFYLLGSLTEYMEWSSLEPNMKNVVLILFQRLQNSKTTKFVKGFLVYISLLAGKQTGSTVIKLIDSIQAGLFGMVVEKIIIQDLQKVTGPTERKICAVGIAKILTEAPSMLTTYVNFWPQLLQALIGLFELPEDDSVPDDEHFIEVEETPGYQTAFSELMFAGKKEHDPFHVISEPKEFLAKQLYKLSLTCPGKLGPMISQGLEPNAMQFLQGYLTQAQVSIA